MNRLDGRGRYDPRLFERSANYVFRASPERKRDPEHGISAQRLFRQMKPSVRQFAVKRLRHLVMLLAWGAGIVVFTKIARYLVIFLTGKDYGNDNINIVGAAGIAVVGIWIGMTVLEFLVLRKSEHTASRSLGSGEET